MATACHSTPSDEREEAARRALAEASARASARASADASTAPVATGAPTPSATARAATGEPASSVTLRNGARLKLPEGAIAKPFDAARRLPEEVKKAHLFHLGTNERLLMINEMDLVNGSCEATLDREAKRMKSAQKDTDPERLKYRKMGVFEELKIDGHRALYGKSKNRGLAFGEGTERPMVAMGTMLMCRDDSYVAMMFVSKKPELPTGMKKMLSDIVASYSK
jgi:hypothetical protein